MCNLIFYETQSSLQLDFNLPILIHLYFSMLLLDDFMFAILLVTFYLLFPCFCSRPGSVSGP